MSQRKHKNDRFKALHGEITRSDYAKQKKAVKKFIKKTSSEETKNKKLVQKEIKRKKYLKKQNAI